MALGRDVPVTDGPTTHVVSPEQGGVFLIRRGTNVAERHRKALLRLDSKEFQSFKFNLLRDLLLSNVQYRLQLEEKQNLAGFHVDVLLREEAVSRVSFYQALQKVHDATLLAVIHIRNAAGEVL